MKTNKIIYILLLFALILTSCSPGAPVPNNIPPDEPTDLSIYTDRKIAVDSDTANKAYMGTTSAVFNNAVYHSEYTTIHKYMLTSPEDIIKPVPVCPDALCEHNTKSCPLYMPMHNIFLIDEEASQLNNNAPIFYILYESAIKKYNSATNKLEVIYDPNGIFFSSMWLYNDKLYVTYSSDNSIFLARLDTDGSNIKTFSPENSDLYCRYFGFYDNYAYYRDATNSVYKVDFDEDKEEFLFRTDCGFGGKIYDGYLYYGDNAGEFTSDEGLKYSTCSLYRIKIDEIGAGQPELIDTNIMHSSIPNMFFSNGMIIYNKWNPIKKGEVEHTVNYQTVIEDVYSDGTNKCYRYDPDTQKIDIAFEDSGYNLVVFKYLDDQFYIAECYGYEFDENGDIIDGLVYLVYDYKNGTKQFLEYPVFVRPERN